MLQATGSSCLKYIHTNISLYVGTGTRYIDTLIDSYPKTSAGNIKTYRCQRLFFCPDQTIMRFLMYASKNAFYTFCILQYPLSHTMHFQTHASKNACVHRRMHLKVHSLPTLSGKMILQYSFSHILSSSTSNKPSTKHLNTSTHNNAFPLMNNEPATTINLRNTSNTP